MVVITIISSSLCTIMKVEYSADIKTHYGQKVPFLIDVLFAGKEEKMGYYYYFVALNKSILSLVGNEI